MGYYVVDPENPNRFVYRVDESIACRICGTETGQHLRWCENREEPEEFDDR